MPSLPVALPAGFCTALNTPDCVGMDVSCAFVVAHLLQAGLPGLFARLIAKD
jgi:hypothetical protein